MSYKRIVSNLDSLLRPLGFTRERLTWNRSEGHIVDVIDLHISKGRDTATVNAGVLDPEIYAKLWGREAEKFAPEAACTVRARIGELIAGYDTWWSLDDSEASQAIPTAVAEYALPFLDRMHSRDNMVQWLSDVQAKRFPYSMISLAILRSALGQRAEACALLAGMRNKAVGPWRKRIAEIAEQLGCGQD